MTSDRLRSVGLLAAAILLCSFVLLVQADIALHKGFWLDEGFEIVRTCGQSFSSLLKDGAYECSPAPLYWLAQTAVIRSVDAVGLSLRLQYRAISLGASALTVLILTLGLGRRVGILAALVAFSSLAADPGFHHHATLNRAYMTWALATAVLVFAAAAVSVDTGPRPRWWLPALLGAGGLVSMAALPGCLQALGAFAACVLIRRWLNVSPGLGRWALLMLALGGLALVALDVRYWAGSPCRGYTAAGDLDIAIVTDRWSLVRRALTVLWPEATSIWVVPAYAALLAGALTPLVLGRRRSTLTETERCAFALSVIALSQIALAIPVGLGLALGRYLFLPRMFIFVMVPRAVLIGLGFWLLASGARRMAAGRSERLAGMAAVAIALIATALSLRFTVQWARASRFPLPPVGQIACPSLKSPELRVLERPQPRGYAFTPNFLVRLGRALEVCAATPMQPAGARYLLALDATTQADWFRVVDVPPPGFEPMQVCQAPVILREGRRAGR
jgi:hypothetical protein